MKRNFVFIIIILLTISAAGYFFYRTYFAGVGPALRSPSQDITKLVPPASDSLPPAQNATDLPLKLPPGFSISIFAKDLSGARDMAFGDDGNMWVSRTKEGFITRLDIRNGVVFHQEDVLTNLRNPHGLAFDPKLPRLLYYSEEDKISYIDLFSTGKPRKIIDLPAGGNHNYHSIRFGPDGRLYVKLGSTCNVCVEKDERRGTIYSMKSDGSDFKLFAKGLRNAPFMTFNPVDGKMWVTEMGRDFLGDDLPPDEINIIGSPSANSGQNPSDFGWPNCYGKNIHDTDFDKNTYIRNPCMEPFEIPSFVDIPAHSAPLGLAFVPGDSAWPEDYWYDLIVAYHGSWNRTVPTGYKVVRMKFDAKGNYQGVEDFMSGWLTSEGALGRPVGTLVQSDGIMYVSDDKAGVIYKVTYVH